jgi:biopolymer transport protein ExbD
MSMDVGGAKGGVKSDINVTPLVDVMLVLLIIMMIVAPMMQQTVNLTLPQARNRTEKPDTADQTVAAIDAQGRLYVNGAEAANQDDAVARLQASLENKVDKTVYLKGDKDATYGAIMSMMDALRKANIESVALIADPPPGEAQAARGGTGGGQ